MIKIMMAGNKKVFDGMLIATLSIVKHCPSDINLYILTMDLSNMDERYVAVSEKQVEYLNDILKEKNPNSKAIRIDATKLYLEKMKNSPNNFDSYTPYAFLRLFADKIDILPDKILYLDTDVVVNANLEELYDINIDDYELAGALDYYGKWFFNKKYINSGVLLLNLKNIRKTKLFEKTLTLCSKKKIFLADQTAINKLSKKKLIIDRKFNEQKKLYPDTVIRHFSKTIKFLPYFHTQNIKPWQIEQVQNELNISEFNDILEDYQNRIKSFK